MKVFTGQVISKKMKKTATVVVDRVVEHPIYKKRYKKTKKYHVHDELNVKVGQVVKFAASKPYSKLKKWRVVEIVGESKSKSKSKSKRSNAKGRKNKKSAITDVTGSKRIARKISV
jgi:small subunit ribosomal protein S17